jgi:hypothetical protein
MEGLGIIGIVGFAGIRGETGFFFDLGLFFGWRPGCFWRRLQGMGGKQLPTAAHRVEY